MCLSWIGFYTYGAVSIYTIFLDFVRRMARNGNGIRKKTHHKESEWKKWDISSVFHFIHFYYFLFILFVVFSFSVSKFVWLLCWRFSLDLDRTKCFLVIVKCVCYSYRIWDENTEKALTETIELHCTMRWHTTAKRREIRGRETKIWNILHSFIHTTQLGWLLTGWHEQWTCISHKTFNTGVRMDSKHAFPTTFVYFSSNSS